MSNAARRLTSCCSEAKLHERFIPQPKMRFHCVIKSIRRITHKLMDVSRDVGELCTISPIRPRFYQTTGIRVGTFRSEIPRMSATAHRLTSCSEVNSHACRCRAPLHLLFRSEIPNMATQGHPLPCFKISLNKPRFVRFETLQDIELLRTEFSFPHLRSRDHCAIGTTSSPHPPPCPRASARSVLTERRLLRKKKRGAVPRRGRRGSFARRAACVPRWDVPRRGRRGAFARRAAWGRLR